MKLDPYSLFIFSQTNFTEHIEKPFWVLKEFLFFSFVMLLFFLLGLGTAYLVWGMIQRKLTVLREDNLMLTGRLNEIIEDQNGLLGSLNARYGGDRLEDPESADSVAAEAELVSRQNKINSLRDDLKSRKKAEKKLRNLSGNGI